MRVVARRRDDADDLARAASNSQLQLDGVEVDRAALLARRGQHLVERVQVAQDAAAATASGRRRFALGGPDSQAQTCVYVSRARECITAG